MASTSLPAIPPSDWNATFATLFQSSALLPTWLLISRLERVLNLFHIPIQAGSVCTTRHLTNPAPDATQPPIRAAPAIHPSVPIVNVTADPGSTPVSMQIGRASCRER